MEKHKSDAHGFPTLCKVKIAAFTVIFLGKKCQLVSCLNAQKCIIHFVFIQEES